MTKEVKIANRNRSLNLNAREISATGCSDHIMFIVSSVSHFCSFLQGM